MFKVNNRNTRTICEICSKLTIKIPYFTPCSSVSTVNFEQVNAGWVDFKNDLIYLSVIDTNFAHEKYFFNVI